MRFTSVSKFRGAWEYCTARLKSSACDQHERCYRNSEQRVKTFFTSTIVADDTLNCIFPATNLTSFSSNLKRRRKRELGGTPTHQSDFPLIVTSFRKLVRQIHPHLTSPLSALPALYVVPSRIICLLRWTVSTSQPPAASTLPSPLQALKMCSMTDGVLRSLCYVLETQKLS